MLIILSGLSLIHDITFWYAEILDFPRFQYLILSVVCLILFGLLKKHWNFLSVMLVLGLLSAVVIHSVKVGPYFVGNKVVPDFKSEEGSHSSVRILIVNVLMTNRNAQELLKIIENHDPDVVLAMEVNQWWVNQLEVLEQEYPNIVGHPLDNAYGMSLYSKLLLKSMDIEFLKHPDVPSFHAVMTLPSGQNFFFHGIHPVAPVPSSKYPDNLGEKEVALAKVGMMVAQEELPSIVAGDFNDVSWSRTTRFFEDQGNLKNVRLGRGLYNSFNAQSLIMRWPLDHFFVTTEFRLKELKRLPGFGSDHFPVLAELVLPHPD